MKTILAVCSLFLASISWAEGLPPSLPAAADVVKGKVLEVKDVETYSYLRLKTKDGEIWAAVVKAPVKKGAEVTVENATVMNNFESKSLKRTFPQIVFGTLAGTSAAAMAKPHGNAAAAPDAGNVNVTKATGPDARTVAEIMTGGAALKDKTVQVRGKVVKFSPAIMGKNWVHLRDGSGSAVDGTNDLLVTTSSQAAVGDVVVAKGVVRTDKDFGAGYVYKVLVEEATLQK